MKHAHNMSCMQTTLLGARHVQRQKASIIRQLSRSLRCIERAQLRALSKGIENGSLPLCMNEKQPKDNLDAIIVLAGGLREDGSLPPWVHRRLDLAADVFKIQSGPCSILCSGGGTPHKPTVLTPEGYVLFESTSCATYLFQKGIDPHSVLKETASFDTVGNSYFSLAVHAIPSKWRRVGVVTSRFHMPRSCGIFETCFAIAANDIFGNKHWYDLSFYAASDEGLFDDEAYAVRQQKEAQSLKAWHNSTSHMTTMAELHKWLFATHMCYAAPRQHEFGKPTDLDPKLLASY